MSAAETKQALRGTGSALRKAASTAKHSMTETLCKQCDPPVWVRRLDFENHRANYHRRGGYMYERRKQRERDIKASATTAEQSRRQAEKAEQRAAARAQRPTNPGKTTTKESMVAGGTNGGRWGARPAAPSSNGQQDQSGAPAAMTVMDGIVQLFWTWARQVPPSIPASRTDAQASAEMWRQAADAVRARARAEAEANRIPPDLLEPYLQVSQQLSQLGDLHMEVVKRVTQRYGQVAETLADPRTPSAEFLKGGV